VTVHLRCASRSCQAEAVAPVAGAGAAAHVLGAALAARFNPGSTPRRSKQPSTPRTRRVDLHLFQNGAPPAGVDPHPDRFSRSAARCRAQPTTQSTTWLAVAPAPALNTTVKTCSTEMMTGKSNPGLTWRGSIPGSTSTSRWSARASDRPSSAVTPTPLSTNASGADCATSGAYAQTRLETIPASDDIGHARGGLTVGHAGWTGRRPTAS
jgi:hypothetical protein